MNETDEKIEQQGRDDDEYRSRSVIDKDIPKSIDATKFDRHRILDLARTDPLLYVIANHRMLTAKDSELAWEDAMRYAVVALVKQKQDLEARLRAALQNSDPPKEL